MACMIGVEKKTKRMRSHIIILLKANVQIYKEFAYSKSHLMNNNSELKVVFAFLPDL